MMMLSHLFVNCDKVRSFWNVIYAWLKKYLKKKKKIEHTKCFVLR